jgi:NADH-quinone oxidoreductase subunit B
LYPSLKGPPLEAQALIAGMIKLQEKIDKESIRKVRWYRKGPDTVEVPVPILGPDLIDPRRAREIENIAAIKEQEPVANVEAQEG